MVDNNRKVRRIVEHFSRKREGVNYQLTILSEQASSAIDNLLSESAKNSLKNKANSHDIPLPVIHELYRRGIHSWCETPNLKIDQNQAGFLRVNSFISKGKTYFKEDSDLIELCDKKQIKKTIKFNDFTKKIQKND